MTKPAKQAVPFESASSLPIGANEVLTSPELAKRLKHLSPSNSRQLLSRAGREGLIWRSEHLQLPSRARLFAHRHFVGQEQFLKAILPVLSQHRPGIGRVLEEMLRNKAIHIDTAKKLLAASLTAKATDDARAFSDELNVLKELGVGVVDDSGSGAPRLIRPMLLGSDESISLGHQLAAQQLLDQQLTSLLFQDHQNQSLIAWGSMPATSIEHSFNGQWFSAHGYSWLRPLVQFDKIEEPRPCPTVFDVRSGVANRIDVEAFAARIKRAGYRPKSNLRILGVMGARFFTPEAFELGKQLGFLLINFTQSIGDEALEALASIDRILSLAETKKNAKGSTPDYVDLFAKLRFHPQAKALASLAFESLTACIVQSSGWNNARTNLSVKFKETSRDVDVSARRGDEYLIIECKAYSQKKSLEVSDVTKFFGETMPSFLRHMGPRKPVRGLHAEIWTTGKITADCEDELKRFKIQNPKHNLILRSSDKIIVPNDIKSMGPLLQCIANL